MDFTEKTYELSYEGSETQYGKSLTISSSKTQGI